MLRPEEPARALSPRFFQWSISPASTRAGQRFSSIPSASSSCLSRRIWSSVSRIVKSLLSPTSSACLRRIFTPMAWKVPSQGMPSTAWPTMLPTRSFISRAALFVNVTERISAGRARPVERMCAIRLVKTRVLPVPAPANTKTGPSRVSTASRCSGLRSSRYRGLPARAAIARAAMPPGGGRRSLYGLEIGLFCWISQEPASLRESWIENGTRGLDLRGCGPQAMMKPMMKAILLTRTGDPSVLDYVEVPDSAAYARRGAGTGRYHRRKPARASGAPRSLSLDAAAAVYPRHRDGRHNRRTGRRREPLRHRPEGLRDGP